MSALSNIKNIQPRVGAKSGKRRTSVSKGDEIATALDKAQTPDAVAALAGKYGITDAEVLERAKKAPNFGQWRMVLGNRIRGIVKRIAEAKAKGNTLTREQAAYPKLHRAKINAAKAATKKVEASKKVTTKKVSKKVVKKTATARVAPAAVQAQVDAADAAAAA